MNHDLAVRVIRRGLEISNVYPMRLELLVAILHNIRQRTIQQLTQKIQGMGGYRITSLHPPDGRAADPAFDLKRIGGCTTQLHGTPQRLI